MVEVGASFQVGHSLHGVEGGLQPRNHTELREQHTAHGVLEAAPAVREAAKERDGNGDGARE